MAAMKAMKKTMDMKAMKKTKDMKSMKKAMKAMKGNKKKKGFIERWINVEAKNVPEILIQAWVDPKLQTIEYKVFKLR
jgi:hypothetical protein